MFITLTIDTNKKKKAKTVRFSKKKFDPARGWKKRINVFKRRTALQKVKAWYRSIKNGTYRLDGQVAMF